MPEANVQVAIIDSLQPSSHVQLNASVFVNGFIAMGFSWYK